MAYFNASLGRVGEKSGCDIVSRSLSWKVNRGVTTPSSGHLSGVTAAHNGIVLNGSGTTHNTHIWACRHVGGENCEVWSLRLHSTVALDEKNQDFQKCRALKTARCNVLSRVMLGELGGISIGGLRFEGVSNHGQSNPPPPTFLFKTHFTPCCCFLTVLQ